MNTLTMADVTEARTELGSKITTISGSLDKVDQALWTLQQATVPTDLVTIKGTVEIVMDKIRRSMLGEKINLMEQSFLLGGVQG